MRLELKLRRNPDYGEGAENTPRYFFEIDLRGIVRNEVKAMVPVFWRPNRAGHPLLKEIYHAEIAGLKLEKGNLAALQRTVPEALARRIRHRTLPYYLFYLPNGDEIPVYYSRGKFKASILDAPGFIGREIGQLWQRIGRYLLGKGRIKAEQELSLNLLLWKDLRLHPAAFIIKDLRDRMWIPIFSQGYGEARLIYDVPGSPSRFFALEEAFTLRNIVVPEFSARGIPPSELKFELLQQGLEAKLERQALKTEWALSYYREDKKKEIPVLRAGDELFAIQNRSVYFGRDVEELREGVARELEKKGMVSSSGHVVIESKGGESKWFHM